MKLSNAFTPTLYTCQDLFPGNADFQELALKIKETRWAEMRAIAAKKSDADLETALANGRNRIEVAPPTDQAAQLIVFCDAIENELSERMTKQYFAL
jgi:hypothetical protein